MEKNVVPARTMRDSCGLSCSFKCAQRISKVLSEFNRFWSLYNGNTFLQLSAKSYQDQGNR